MPTETHRDATEATMIHNTQHHLVLRLTQGGWYSGAAVILHDARRCATLLQELDTIVRPELRQGFESILKIAQRVFALAQPPAWESHPARSKRVESMRVAYVGFLSEIPRPADSDWHISRGQREAVIDGIEVYASMDGRSWSITLSDRGIGLPKFYVNVERVADVDKAARAAVAQYLASIA